MGSFIAEATPDGQPPTPVKCKGTIYDVQFENGTWSVHYSRLAPVVDFAPARSEANLLSRNLTEPSGTASLMLEDLEWEKSASRAKQDSVASILRAPEVAIFPFHFELQLVPQPEQSKPDDVIQART
jgi:hypothetical protein